MWKFIFFYVEAHDYSGRHAAYLWKPTRNLNSAFRSADEISALAFVDPIPFCSLNKIFLAAPYRHLINGRRSVKAFVRDLLVALARRGKGAFEKKTPRWKHFICVTKDVINGRLNIFKRIFTLVAVKLFRSRVGLHRRASRSRTFFNLCPFLLRQASPFTRYTSSAIVVVVVIILDESLRKYFSSKSERSFFHGRINAFCWAPEAATYKIYPFLLPPKS